MYLKSIPKGDKIWKKKINKKSTAANAVNENLQTIHRYVERVKHNREAGAAYMRTREWITEAIDLGWEHGVERGREEGMRQGIQEGIEQGIEQGIKEKERINQLTILLINQGRQADLLRAAQDQEYQQELLEEFKL